MDPTSLIKSTSSLNKISRSFNGLSASITRSSFLTRSIAKTINEDNRSKKIAISTDGSFFRKRRESILRRKREEQVEATGVSGVLKQKGKIVKDTGKGFLGRVLSFIGIILLGFLVTKLPAILKGVQALIKRIQQVVGILTGFVNGVIGIFEGMGKKLDQIISFLNPFDKLGEQKERTQKTVEDVQRKQAGLTNGFISSVNRYKDDSDLDEIIKEIEEKRNRPWWDPFGVFDPKEGELTENDQEEIYNSSKSNEDKAWNDLSPKEQEEFIKKNTQVKTAEDMGVLSMNKGGELKKGEAAIVGDDDKGKGKDRELFIPNQDGFILPNNITEKFLEASSFLESKKLSSLKIGKEYDVNIPPSRIDYPQTVTGFREFTRDLKQWGKDNPLGTKFGQKVEPSVEPSDSMIESLKSVGDSLKPQMESVANELKEVIDTPEMQKTITNVKKSMQGVLKEITPKRKGQTIMIPAPQGGQSKSSGGGGGVLPTSSTSGAASGRLNIKEYHKHLTTLITAYT